MTLQTWEKADKVMAEYFTDLFEDGSCYNAASYTLYGYILLRTNESIPEKDLFPLARGALKGWNAHSPQSTRTGADPQVWYVIADDMARRNPPAAAALLLQLDSYARPSEIVSLQFEDIIKPSSKQCKYWGIIFGNSDRGEVTKTGAQDDCVLLDSLDRDYAPQLLSWVVKKMKLNHQPLFPDLTLPSYEEEFRQSKRRLRLSAFQLTPHTVRHSGPSADALTKSRSLAEIQSRGRWLAPQSVQRYKKPGKMLAQMARIPPHVWELAKTALPQVLHKLKQFYK